MVQMFCPHFVLPFHHFGAPLLMVVLDAAVSVAELFVVVVVVVVEMEVEDDREAAVEGLFLIVSYHLLE